MRRDDDADADDVDADAKARRVAEAIDLDADMRRNEGMMATKETTQMMATTETTPQPQSLLNFSDALGWPRLAE